MADAKDLVGVSGRPLVKERKVAVVKVPKGVHIHPSIYEGISRMTGCAVLELPMDCEFMMGELAVKELESLHHAIHNILEQPDIVLSREELTVFHDALGFLCEKTSPGNSSKELTLLRKIKKLVS